ncbi:ornithine aminomutase subunit alpha [Clostridium sp. CCUG 7971]|uniref:ornithine aminomutase subunit alpha n=1 Tax=Clostridium sp. CCUG 7971 TaxID=2811414 RepID=UPI001ABA4E46|nr:ornithine aminomutase subunit alpha [Clostridium sp. CCUG 7971]MBO3445043.1 ornithine aminomutase subunit alpha [Clostridium sp. CCUG 7971]
MKKRLDDYKDRRTHLSNLSDEELHARFWKLAEEIVDPMLELGRKNTSPSIERSVLLRMGFSSLEAKEIVNIVLEKGLISKGAGHAVYKLAKVKNISVRDAGVKLANGEFLDEIDNLFGKEEAPC